MPNASLALKIKDDLDTETPMKKCSDIEDYRMSIQRLPYTGVFINIGKIG
jgi:hypothetical protein